MTRLRPRLKIRWGGVASHLWAGEFQPRTAAPLSFQATQPPTSPPPRQSIPPSPRPDPPRSPGAAGASGTLFRISCGAPAGYW
ncbi:hypothetical protein CALVIDRAFT_533199, partial [Calocera viscosa TUFC12733]